jgi:integrase
VIPKPKKKVSKTALRNKCDVLASRYYRALTPYCELNGLDRIACSGSLSWAHIFTRSIIHMNPAHGAKLPRTVRTEPMYLTPEQVGALAEAAGPYELMILTLAFTGLRFGELAALKVGRFDPVRKRLSVAESVTEVGSQLVWTTPKTHQTRSVPVPGQIAMAIEDSCMGKLPDHLIFTSPLGKTLRLNNWRKNVFDPAVKTTGLVGLRPHDLRHTAASLAIRSGAHVKVVQQMLGHASAAMTLDVYAGLFEDDLDSVAERLDSLTPCQVPVPA